ncbi:MAG TPA: hypothetical protein VNT54_05460 [Solirubrobacteraceae bacterium]|nr:hypothetical protein [Solirubrobacteraceae bacterium]
MAAKGEYTTLEAAGREIRISSPSKVYFPQTKIHRAFTKLDLAEYYLRVADATVNHLRERPTTLKRWRDGITAATSSSRSACPRSGPSGCRRRRCPFPPAAARRSSYRTTRRTCCGP